MDNAKASVGLPPDLSEKIIWSPPVHETIPNNGSELPSNASPITGHTCPDTADSNAESKANSYMFSDEMISEVRSRISYALSPAVQLESINAYKSLLSADSEGVRIPEPVVSLYYAKEGCHEIIDSMVKLIAKQLELDILTLDSLELALGEHGCFGKGIADAISASYKDPDITLTDEGGKNDKVEAHAEDDSSGDESSDDEEVKKRRRREKRKKEKETEQKQKIRRKRMEEERSKVDSAIQDVFNSIIALQRHHSDSNSPQETKGRIIYLRDFGSIAESSEPLLVRLARSVHARRNAESGRLQPTVLIKGFCKQLTDDVSDDEDDYPRSFLHPTRSASSHRRMQQIIKGLPEPSNRLFRLPSSSKQPSMSALPSAFFVNSLNYSNSHIGPYCTTFTGTFTFQNFDFPSVASSLLVLPNNSKSPDFRKIEERLSDNRKGVIASAWLKLCLASRGAVASQDILSSISQDNYIQTSLLPDTKSRGTHQVAALLELLSKHVDSTITTSLNLTVSTACGLSARSGSPDAPTEIPSSAFVNAYRILIENSKARTRWLDRPDTESEDDTDTKSVDDTYTESEDDTKRNELEHPKVRKVKEAGDLTSYEQRLLGSIINVAELQDTSFDDVCVPSAIVETLRRIVSLPLLFPSAFKSGILSKESIGGVLLYGPPGTGKTLLCRAVAQECGAQMLFIKPSDVMDCYVGTSEKLVKAIFTMAYRLSPCLIFIDEVDALFGKRKEDDKKWYRLSEFLQSMDGLRSAKKNKEAGVIVIGATNRPYDVDDAIIRRLPSRMMVGVPSLKEREQILKLHLRTEKLDGDVNLNDIAAKTENYTGSDIKNLCVSAAMASITDAVGDIRWNRANAKNFAETKEMNTSDHQIEADDPDMEEAQTKVASRCLTKSHFEHAMSEVPPSVSVTSHSELRRWHEQFGRKSGVSNTTHSYLGGNSRYGPSTYAGAGGYSTGVGKHPETSGGFYGVAGTPFGASSYSSAGSYSGAGASYAGRANYLNRGESDGYINGSSHETASTSVIPRGSGGNTNITAIGTVGRRYMGAGSTPSGSGEQ